MKKSMILLLTIVCMTGLILACSTLAAEEEQQYSFDEAVGSLKDKKGTDIMPEDWTAGIRPEGNLEAVVVDVEGEEFDQAVRLKTTQLGSAAWDAQFWVDIGTGIHKGDTIFFGFKMRGIDSITNKESTAVFTNTRLRPDGNTSVNLDAEGYISNEWQQFFMAAESPVGATENGTFVFHLGLAEQTVEIADIFVITYRKEVSVSQLPIMKKTYEGMEEDAQWREDALGRIEEIRKSDLTIEITDEQGNPIPNAMVAVKQKRHSYGFGTIVNANDYFNMMTSSQKEQYLNTVNMLSNRSGFENAMKMNYIEDSEANIDFFLDWFEENDIDVRGHVLIYGDYKRLPADRQEELIGNSEALKAFTIEHIKKYVTKYQGRIDNWDVVNENMTSDEFTKLLGNEVVVEWFQAARDVDEDVKLTLNDFGILSRDTGHQDYHYELAEYLIDQNAAITTIGIQGHVGLVPPENILNILDRFAELGKEIEITEFTFAEKDEELQAQFTKDFLIAVFSHPATTSVVTWGFWENSMYEPDAAMVREDFSMKPNGQVWMDLIYDEWWTDKEGTADTTGIYSERVFHGNHEVTVCVADETIVFDIDINQDGGFYKVEYKDGKLSLR